MALNTTVKAALLIQPSALRSVPRGAFSLMPVSPVAQPSGGSPNPVARKACHPDCPCGPTIGGKATTKPGQDEHRQTHHE
jgi:hypothetical protein